jgi:hypothetical protein
VVDGSLAELERPVYFSGSDAPPGAYGLKGTLGRSASGEGARHEPHVLARELVGPGYPLDARAT